jgi:D-3-phosphoglycerate dehydrogenase / 2-oxoglutarate reductase
LKPRVIITALAHAHLSEGLRAMGYEVHVDENITYGELLAVMDQYEGLVVSTRIEVDQGLIDRGIALKWIGRLGSGMEIIDVDHAATKNIHCFSSPEGNRDAVAELALGMLISVLRHVHTAREEVIQGKWIREANRGTELRGKKIGIVGFGNTGRAFAELLSGFGVQVLAHDKYVSGFSSGHVAEVDLNSLQQDADVISFHLPLTKETRYYANRHFFSGLMRRPILINTSRGSVVDTSGLEWALDNGLIGGAALDVLENESLSTYSSPELLRLTQLASRPNVLITPHIAGYSHEALYKMADVLLQKLKGL